MSPPVSVHKMAPRKSNRPKFITKMEVTRIFELKEAGYAWKTIGTKMNRKWGSVKKKYFREKAIRNTRQSVYEPKAILSHREVATTAGTLSGIEYEVLWEGHEDISWESYATVRNLDVYKAYNIQLQRFAFGRVPTRVLR